MNEKNRMENYKIFIKNGVYSSVCHSLHRKMIGRCYIKDVS